MADDPIEEVHLEIPGVTFTFYKSGNFMLHVPHQVGAADIGSRLRQWFKDNKKPVRVIKGSRRHHYACTFSVNFEEHPAPKGQLGATGSRVHDPGWGDSNC